MEGKWRERINPKARCFKKGIIHRGSCSTGQSGSHAEKGWSPGTGGKAEGVIAGAEAWWIGWVGKGRVPFWFYYFFFQHFSPIHLMNEDAGGHVWGLRDGRRHGALQAPGGLGVKLTEGVLGPLVGLCVFQEQKLSLTVIGDKDDSWHRRCMFIVWIIKPSVNHVLAALMPVLFIFWINNTNLV